MKLCRQRQNELWANIERRGQMEVISASASGIGQVPPIQVAEPVPKPASSAEHTPKISTTADIKRLQSIGALKIQQDTSGNRTVRWSVSGVSLIDAVPVRKFILCSGIFERSTGNAEKAGRGRETTRRIGFGDLRPTGQRL